MLAHELCYLGCHHMMKLLCHSQTSTVVPLKFGNEKVIQSFTLQIDARLLTYYLRPVEMVKCRRRYF